MRYLFFVFFIFLTINQSNSSEFATINYEKIYNESKAFKLFLKDIDKYKKKQINYIKTIEKKLLLEKNDLDESKLILSDEQFSKKITIYEKNIESYEDEVNSINNNIYLQIEEAKSILEDEILKILKELAKEKEILIIFDENNYKVAIKKIDITEDVIKILNGNIKKISEFTGMERTALYRKFKTLNINTDNI